MFFVVYGHIVAYYSPDIAGSIAKAVCSFHMPLFFFISGYTNSLVHRIEGLNVKRYLWRKTEVIIIPYLAWSFLIPIMIGKTTISSWDDVVSILHFYPNLGIWFLPVLFIFFVVYSAKALIINICKKNSITFDLALSAFFVCCFASLGVLFNEYHLIVYGILLSSFFLGEYFWRIEKIKSISLTKLMYGISAIALLCLWQVFPLQTGGNKLYSLYNLIMTVLCSFFGIVFCFNFFVKVKLPKWLSLSLSEIGKNTMPIYLIPIFLFPMSLSLSDEWTFTTINLACFVIAIVDTSLRYAIGRFIYQIPYISFLLFGKRSR